jgi:hypothetical protein
MMEPFFEGREVEPYEAECYNCGGTGYLDHEDTHVCEDCDGSGVVMSTCNPDGWWDWYVIGGRWDGVLTGRESGVDSYSNALENNACRVADIILCPHKYPYTIVTPDDGVHMNEDANYKAKPDWADAARRVLWKHAEHYAVVVDYHC